MPIVNKCYVQVTVSNLRKLFESLLLMFMIGYCLIKYIIDKDVMTEQL